MDDPKVCGSGSHTRWEDLCHHASPSHSTCLADALQSVSISPFLVLLHPPLALWDRLGGCEGLIHLEKGPEPH